MESKFTIDYLRETKLFLAFKDAGFEPRVFFEIGSSNSAWSYQMAEIFPGARFHLFEPLLDHKAYYREGTEGVLRAHPDFRIHKVAAGDIDGTTKMGVDASGCGASTLVTETNETFTEIIEVPIRRLDSLVFEQDLPRPEVLKIDVQGGELGVLIGAGSLLDTVQLIQAEAWFTRGYWNQTPLLQEIMEYLSAKGFLFVAFGSCFYSDLHELSHADAFFARTDLLRRCAAALPKGSLTS